MDNNSMRNIVVLKDLPSNVIEEVFVILKKNQNVKKLQYIDKKHEEIEFDNKEKVNEDYIVKEAEMIVSEYISKLENDRLNKNSLETKLNKKYKKMKLSVFCLGILLVLSMLF